VFVCVFLLKLLSKGSAKCIPPFGVRQRIGKHVSAAANICNSRKNLDASFSMQSVSYQMRICGSVYPLTLLCNNSVKTFPRQRRIVGGFVLYAVSVVSKEIRGLILPRTSCL
jgi:hypothetical protein